MSQKPNWCERHGQTVPCLECHANDEAPSQRHELLQELATLLNGGKIASEAGDWLLSQETHAKMTQLINDWLNVERGQ